MAKKILNSKGNQSVAKATTTTAAPKTIASTGASKSTPTYTAPKVSAGTGAAKSTNISTPTVKTYDGGGNSKSSNTSSSYGGQSKSTVNNVNINDTMAQVRQEAQRQAEAGKQYVQNMLNQLQSTKPIQAANNFFTNTNPNISPMQRTNDMLSAIKTLSGTNSGKAALNRATNAMQGDPRYQGRTLEEDVTNPAVTPDDLMNLTISGIYGGATGNMFPLVGDIATVAGRDTLNSINNAVSDALQRPTTDAMAGDARYQTPDSYKTLAEALSNSKNDGLGDHDIRQYSNPNYLFETTANIPEGEPVRPYSNPNYDFETPRQHTLYDSLLDLFRDNGEGMRTKGDYGVDVSALGSKDDGIGNYGTKDSGIDVGNYGTKDDGTDVYNNVVSGNSGKGGSGRNGRNGSNGTSGGYVGGDGSIDISALYDLLNQRLGEYDANFDEMMQALLDSYNMNFGSLESAYLDALNRLGLNYADTEALLNGNLDTSRQALEDDRTRALQEAYISRMMQEKNLADQLDAYGLSGGATESVMADLRNNYANNRASVEDKVQQSLRELLQTYMQNLSDARGRYNEQLLSAEQSRLNAAQNLANQFQDAQNSVINQRSNARAGAYEDLYNTLANLTMKGINYVS